jgi:hypothetical protein
MNRSRVVIVASEGAAFYDVPHFAGGIVPGDNSEPAARKSKSA